MLLQVVRIPVCFLSLFLSSFFLLLSPLHFVPGNEKGKRIQDRRRRRRTRVIVHRELVSFLVLFMVCARVACNDQRCVETVGPYAGLCKWGCKLACLPLFADLCARITLPQANGHLEEDSSKGVPLLLPVLPRFSTCVPQVTLT